MSSMESSFLPTDIIYEIFSRVSYDTLGRCGVVCKHWNQITYDSRLHSQMNNIVVGFLAQRFSVKGHHCFFTSISDETHKISLNFVPGFYVTIEAVSANHGIILCNSYNPGHYMVTRFFVYKPRLKLFQQIPNPNTKLRTKRVAIYVIRSKPFRYKILRISSSEEKFVNDYRKLYYEVFDSETWTWKKPKDITLLNHTMFKTWEAEAVTIAVTIAVTVGGAFHWLMYPNFVFSFNVEEEERKIHGLPVKEDYDSMKLVEYEEKLALICMDSEGYMQTWVLENYKNPEWRIKFRINMKDFDRVYPMAFYGSDIIVVRNYWSLMYYDFKNGKVLKVTKLEKDILPICLYPFWWNSEPCSGSSESGVQRFEEEEEDAQ